MANGTPKSVQAYLDETPTWADGTTIHTVELTAMQWRIWWLAAAGKFFEGMIVFMTGVALPLVALEFDLDAAGQGMVGAATLAGILVGATALGGLADHVGRKLMFIVEMAIFTVFLALTAACTTFPLLLVCLFGIGVALGCDYPTAHLVISESIASNRRGRLVLGAFAFQAVGALTGTAVGYFILRADGGLRDWRLMYVTAVIPALLVTIGRLSVTRSAHWLVHRGRIREAERELRRLLHRRPAYPSAVTLAQPEADGHGPAAGGWRALFSPRHRRATLLASVPWFLQDLGTYGIGIFTPTILATTIGKADSHGHNLAAVVHADMLAARGAAMIDVLLIAGIVAAILLVDRVGRIRLQMLGFVGCAAGLLIAALSMQMEGTAQLVLVFAGFMLFNFMTNLGPNATTYLLAGEVFPTAIRGRGAGLAASVGKIGAVLTAFLFPILLKDIGVGALLCILMATSLLGAWITAHYAIETTGVNLETLEASCSHAT